MKMVNTNFSPIEKDIKVSDVFTIKKGITGIHGRVQPERINDHLTLRVMYIKNKDIKLKLLLNDKITITHIIMPLNQFIEYVKNQIYIYSYSYSDFIDQEFERCFREIFKE
ncbi:hypothetical protein [Bacillus velezensis]